MVRLGHKLETIEDKGDRSVLTFANGETVEADLVIGADGIKSAVRQQLFSDQEPVFAGEHAYRVVISADDAHGMVVDDNLRMYIGRGTKVYLLPLRHRNGLSFDITALNPDGTWAPQVTQGGPAGDGGGLRRADREHRPRPRHGHRQHPRRLRHRPGRHLAHRLRRPAWATRPTRCCTTRARARTPRSWTPARSPTPCWRPDSVAGGAGRCSRPTRKPVTDELQRISRQGWTEDELDDVFPGQKPAGAGEPR